MRYVLVGYYGAGNPGDEALLAALVGQLRRLDADAQFRVVSHAPAHTEAAHEVAAIGRAEWGALGRALSWSDGVIAGGGSLLTDASSMRSFAYYAGVFEWAGVHRVPVVLCAQGVGPLRSPLARRWTQRVVARARHVSVRDRVAYERLVALGMPASRVALGADLVYALPRERPTAVLRPAQGVPPGIEDRAIVLVVRRRPGWAQVLPGVYAGTRRLADALGRPLRVVAFTAPDAAVAAEVTAGAARIWIPATWQAALSGLGSAALVVSARLHGLLFAALGGVPAVGLDCDPKLAGGAAELALPVLPWSPPLAADIDDCLQALMRAAPAWQHSLPGRLDALGERARQACAAAVRMIGAAL